MKSRHRILLVSCTLLAAGEAAAQQPATVPGAPLTIGAAARAAAVRGIAATVAAERLAQADARARQRRAELYPSVSGMLSNGERTFNSAGLGLSLLPTIDPNGQVLGPVRNIDLRASARVALADPAVLARVGAARAAVDATSADAAAITQQAAAVAAMACVAAMRADAHLAARMADSALAAELLEIARAQLSAGVGIALDVTRSESQLATARSQLIGARSARARTRVELARAIGLPANTALALADELESADAGAQPAATQSAVERRADLKSLAHQLTAAEQQVRAVRAERLPALSAFADDGATGISTNHLLNTWTWGIQLGVSVFDGFRREGRIAEQRSAVRELDARRRDLAEQVEADVISAQLDLGAAREQVAAALERQRLATQEVAQARDRFSAGVAGNADVITASLNLNAARTFLVDARAALLSARVMLARASGTVTDLP